MLGFLQLFGKGADFFGDFSLFAVHLQGQAEDHAADFLFRQCGARKAD